MFISSQPGRPFAEVATSRKQALGLSFRQLARRTKDLDDTSRGLSSAYLVQLLNGNEHPVPRNITLTAHALDMAPEAFVEYRLHQIRDALDETCELRASGAQPRRSRQRRTLPPGNRQRSPRR